MTISLTMESPRNEARALLRSELLALEARGRSELRNLVDSSERKNVIAGSGREYRVTSSAFWDNEPDESNMYVDVVVRRVGGFLSRPRKSGLVVMAYTDEIIRYANFPGDT